MRQKIILCCLIVTSVRGDKIDIYDTKIDSTERLKSDRELVETCLTNNSNPVMISKELFDYNWNPNKNPLIIIDNVFKKQITSFFPAYPTYVLFFQSIESLKEIINHLKQSALWSIKSPFVIVETESRCKNTRRVLEFLWKKDLLSVYYLCNKKDLTAIFTLNPYASYAPKPWVLIEKFGDSTKNITFYSLQYSKDPELCKSITFEKTDHLKSADIKFTYFSSTDKLLKKQFHDDQLKELINRKVTNLFNIPAYINATPTLEIIKRANSSQLTQGFIQQLVDQTHDVHGSLMPVTETDYKYVDVIADYFHEHEFFILTKKADFFTVINEVSSDVDFVVMTIAVFVMFTIALVLINKEDICGALMDSMRLVVSMGLESPLNRLAMKFIFFCGFLFAFLIVPDFQGHVSAILSNPMRRNFETLEGPLRK
ncbi:GSCOCG00006056001-RA-CDS [Cotesia congregata]|nr:GSCOCG00006056001-RA-CDS [Cotesia congregata]